MEGYPPSGSFPERLDRSEPRTSIQGPPFRDRCSRPGKEERPASRVMPGSDVDVFRHLKKGCRMTPSSLSLGWGADPGRRQGAANADGHAGLQNGRLGCVHGRAAAICAGTSAGPEQAGESRRGPAASEPRRRRAPPQCVVALRHHGHRDPRLAGLRHDLPLPGPAPPKTPTATRRPVARRARILLRNRHRRSVYPGIDGRFRCTRSPRAQPDNTPPMRTGGLRRMDTVRIQICQAFHLKVRSV